MPRFSVVIPLYNKAHFIAATLKSVLCQTFTDFEILMVNDCSTDNSLVVARGFEDDRIKIIEHPKNRGLSASRNTGIRAASSNYIAFLDADDLWKPTYLETMDLLINRYSEAHLFASKYELQLGNGKIIEHQFSSLPNEDHGLLDNFFTSNLNQNIYYPSCLCVHKNVFAKVGYYNESIQFSEDVDFNIRAHAEFKMAYIQTPHVVYRIASENQITQSGLGDKVIPDYDYYEAKYSERIDIKQYLDFQRYVKAKMYKLDGNKERFRSLTTKIDPSNLTWKQRLLLRLPANLNRGISSVKLLLQKKGITIHSYK